MHVLKKSYAAGEYASLAGLQIPHSVKSHRSWRTAITESQ